MPLLHTIIKQKTLTQIVLLFGQNKAGHGNILSLLSPLASLAHSNRQIVIQFLQSRSHYIYGRLSLAIYPYSRQQDGEYLAIITSTESNKQLILSKKKIMRTLETLLNLRVSLMHHPERCPFRHMMMTVVKRWTTCLFRTQATAQCLITSTTPYIGRQWLYYFHVYIRCIILYTAEPGQLIVCGESAAFFYIVLHQTLILLRPKRI